MKTLDRSKSFEEVFGDDPNVPYRYSQGGVKFDDRGREMTDAQMADAIKSAGGAEPFNPDKERQRIRAELEGEMLKKVPNIDALIAEKVAAALAGAGGGSALDALKNEESGAGATGGSKQTAKK